MILLRQGWVRAPPTPLGSPMAHIEPVASLLDTLFQALLTNIETPPRKNILSAFLTALPCNVSDFCTGIDKETIKGVFQAAKKVDILGEWYGFQISGA